MDKKLTLVVRNFYYSKNKKYYGLFRCSCGTYTVHRQDSVKKGATKGCGCTPRNYTHLMSKSKTYISWCAMKSRVFRPKDKRYEHYGGRGIAICERWLKFESFLEDMGERPEGKTLDRINVNGNYEQNNCKWSTNLEQQRNKQRSKRICDRNN